MRRDRRWPRVAGRGGGSTPTWPKVNPVNPPLLHVVHMRLTEADEPFGPKAVVQVFIPFVAQKPQDVRGKSLNTYS